MALTETKDSATIGTTEYFIAADSTTKALQTDTAIVSVWFDLTAMADGDQYEFKAYREINNVECVLPLGVKTGDQGSVPFVLPAFAMADAWDFSVKKLAGTDRSIGWSIVKAT